MGASLLIFDRNCSASSRISPVFGVVSLNKTVDAAEEDPLDVFVLLIAVGFSKAEAAVVAGVLPLTVDGAGGPRAATCGAVVVDEEAGVSVGVRLSFPFAPFRSPPFVGQLPWRWFLDPHVQHRAFLSSFVVNWCANLQDEPLLQPSSVIQNLQGCFCPWPFPVGDVVDEVGDVGSVLTPLSFAEVSLLYGMICCNSAMTWSTYTITEERTGR